MKMYILKRLAAVFFFAILMVSHGARAQAPLPTTPAFTIDQTISDGAQRTTLAFSGLALMTGNLDAQSFFPPGKVADYTGFQYLRDNDPDNMGHNTSFLTRVANNVIYILNASQLAQLSTLAVAQQSQVDLYGYERYPLMQAFRRLIDGNIPSGSSGLDLTAVQAASRELYLIDGQISFDRAVLYASIINSLDATQKAYLDAMKGKGWSSWPDITDAQINDKLSDLPKGSKVAVMTYASDIYSWYAGSLEADVYFCPERHGTYYGGFYIKDAPAVGHEGYSIDEQLTATAGAALSDSTKGYVTQTQAALMSSLVDTQRANLYASASANIVKVRTEIATLLRSLLNDPTSTDSVKAQVLALSGTYGDLDGADNYYYATVFSQVYKTLSSDQKTKLAALRKSILSGSYADGTPFDYSVATTPFLYSDVITDALIAPYVSDAVTNDLFNYDSPSVTSISPASGTTAGGTLVVITGTNLSSASRVTIGGNACTSLSAYTATSITCNTPAGTSGTASVLVTTASGTNAANALYTYVGAPTVASISPTSGTTAGGTRVTITGTNLSGASAVTVGGNACTPLSANTATSITCNTPAGTAGTASVLVTTSSGTNAANALYTFVTPAPTVTLNPSSIKFVDQHIGTTSPVQTVVLTNTGSTALTITDIVSAISDFAASKNCVGGVAAGGSCTLNVTFKPVAIGVQAGAITVTSNAVGSPHRVSVSGAGVATYGPICTLTATPASIRRSGTSTLTASCSPAATSYSWTGGTCAGKTAATCTVTPGVTISYSVTGTNSYGSSTAFATVTIKPFDLTPVLMLLLD